MSSRIGSLDLDPGRGGGQAYSERLSRRPGFGFAAHLSYYPAGSALNSCVMVYQVVRGRVASSKPFTTGRHRPDS